MHTRLLVSLLVSGVVHAGAFVVGSGMYEQFVAGVKSTGRADTLSVSIDVNTVVRDPVETPPVERGTGNAKEPDTKQPPVHSAGARSDEATSLPRVEERKAPERTRTADFEKSPAENAVAEREASGPPREKAPPEPMGGDRSKSRETASLPSASSRQPSLGQDSSKGRETQAERMYLAEFLAELSRHKHYPRSARLREQQGKVVVELMLEKDGTINDVKVARPSSHSVLNRAALRSVQRMKRFKPFPSNLNRKSWRLSIPFQYSIEGR